jgi:hypothetical protein
MSRKEYRFTIEGETYHAPLGALTQLLAAGVIQPDLIIEAGGIRQKLGAVMDPPPATPVHHPAPGSGPRAVAPLTPDQPSRGSAPAGVVFRPFVVLGLILLILVTNWWFFDPTAGRAIPGFSPARRTCVICSGLGKTNCSTCGGSGSRMTVVPRTQYRSTMVPVYAMDFHGKSSIRYESRSQPYTVMTTEYRTCSFCDHGRRQCPKCLGTGTTP